jgi:hypothetical protein
LIVAFCPAFTAPPVQVTVIGLAPDARQVNRLVVSNGIVGLGGPWSVTPAGSVSTTLTLAVFALPRLLTVRT